MTLQELTQAARMLGTLTECEACGLIYSRESYGDKECPACEVHRRRADEGARLLARWARTGRWGERVRQDSTATNGGRSF